MNLLHSFPSVNRARVHGLVLLSVLVLNVPALATDWVWLEGESPTSKNMEIHTASATNKEFLSGQTWLKIDVAPERIEKKLPKEGLILGYEFEAPSEGSYEIWNRIGFEKIRSPFAWRVDQLEWSTIKPEDPTVDLMELDVWCQVAWIKLGDARLSAGKHVLEIRLTPSYKEEKGQKVTKAILYASDALCIHKGPFYPNGRVKPDEEWQTAADKKAAAQTFEVAATDATSPERIETSLSGTWQVCRADEQEVVDRAGPTDKLPDLTHANWMGIAVPSNKYDSRKELRLCHRFIYRTHVKIPAELAGRSFILKFPAVSLIASVHVNGKYCGWTKAPYARWECDVSSAVKPGEINEVCAVVKDTYYAISEKKSGGRNCRSFFEMPLSHLSENWTTAFFDFPVGSPAYGTVGRSGIVLAPGLIVAGNVYASDAFVIPSVKERKVGLEITVFNGNATEKTIQVTNEIVPASGGKAEKTFAPKEMSLPPGKDTVFKFEEPWENPKLWWPDEPNMYQLVTKTLVDGTVVDVRKTPFGFRQWEWSGQQFKLNGIPWQVWADDTAGNAPLPEAVALWKRTDIRICRLYGCVQYAKTDIPAALDYLDAQGIIVRRSGILDGMGANYAFGLRDNPELFENWYLQLKAMVREERNHPSIMIWSLENEITFINARNLGLSKDVEPNITRAAKVVMDLDPTRPVMVDGGNCLMDCSLPVNGVHYIESYFRDYPNEAYTLEKAYIGHEQNVLPGWGKSPWKLMKDRPTFMGEMYFIRGYNPAAFSQFGGEGCFAGWNEQARRGAGVFAKILAEGYRWHGVAAFHYSGGSGDTDGLQNNSYHPVCVFCREWNWTFGSGTDVSRTLKVFNDTRFNEPIESAWELIIDGKRVASGKKEHSLQPGEHQEYAIGFKIPVVAGRTAGELILTCRRGGKEVFREVKNVSVIDPDGPRPKLDKSQIVVLDPFGSIKSRLQARKIEFTDAATSADIPNTARVIVVGKDALTAREATDPRWTALAGSGKRLLIVDQANPLRFTAVPADVTPTNFAGRIAFIENITHPIFTGLDQPDFFTWSGDQVVYRKVYKKASRGATSLAHCDEQLGCSAISECQVNDGLLMLCQMVVGEKLATDPVAQKLFDNMLAYCADYVPIRRTTVVVMDEASPAAKLLTDSGLKYDKTSDVLSAISDGKHDILVCEATPPVLKALAGSLDSVNAFTSRGGWLMLWGLTPEGLADFNRIVGVEHLIRRFELENVSLPALRDPLLSGITMQDVAMESGEQIFPWAGGKYMVDDEFNYIVDFDDIAPFCEFPNTKAGDKVAARKACANWPRNAVNGFLSADAWKLIYYMPTSNPNLPLILPRAEEIVEFDIVLNLHYSKALKVNLYFDDDPTPVSVITKPTEQRQNFQLDKPHKASKVRVELADFDQPMATTGIDNLWIYVKRSDEWRRKVVPLLNMGGLVRYSMGKGGVLLNQLHIKSSEPVPKNVEKKCSIVTTLLRNLHATFAGGKMLTTSNLQYQPIAFDEQCNQYITKDRGWFEGNRDISHIPVGHKDFAGVTYELRDFKTSPLPSCIMLGGPGVKGQMPAEVKGLKISSKADVLFFLHTFNRVKEWRANKAGDVAPVAFKYVVHYADGQSQEVPVRYGEGVDHWISHSPTGLKSATLAWSAPFPGDKSSDEAVVFQMQWNNPRPEAEIQTIDLLYGPEGSKYGEPALLGISAGVESK